MEENNLNENIAEYVSDIEEGTVNEADISAGVPHVETRTDIGQDKAVNDPVARSPGKLEGRGPGRPRDYGRVFPG